MVIITGEIFGSEIEQNFSSKGRIFQFSWNEKNYRTKNETGELFSIFDPQPYWLVSFARGTNGLIMLFFWEYDCKLRRPMVQHMHEITRWCCMCVCVSSLAGTVWAAMIKLRSFSIWKFVKLLCMQVLSLSNFHALQNFRNAVDITV